MGEHLFRPGKLQEARVDRHDIDIDEYGACVRIDALEIDRRLEGVGGRPDARLDALPPDQKGALQRVSVLGDVAREQQVAMLGLGDPGAPLRNLVASGLLRQRPDACYEVADPLLREEKPGLLDWRRAAKPPP